MTIRLSNNDRLSIIENLAIMLASGIPILEAIESMMAETKGNQQKLLDQLKEDLTQGKTIAESFSRFPEAFDPVTINLVKAAEEAGTLDTTLKYVATNIKREIEFSEKIKTAMVYPAFVMVVFLAIMILILAFVIPRIATVFKKLHVHLPLPTQILIAVSNNLLSYWFIWLGVSCLLVIGFTYFYIRKKKVLLNILYTLPILRTLAREIDLTRFTRSMGLLLSSGIPITEALSLAQHVVTKKEISTIITSASTMVAAGKKLSEAFLPYKHILPGIMLRITEAGEKSGKLEESMEELAEYFDIKVSTSLKKIIALLEPVLLVVIGSLIGGIMLAIIAPIYNLIGQIQAR